MAETAYQVVLIFRSVKGSILFPLKKQKMPNYSNTSYAL